MLELEDLQGLSGLKAIRVEVIFQKNQKSLAPKNGNHKVSKSAEEMVADLKILSIN